jgi:hypothetical protein
MATYEWESDLINYKQQVDQVLVTGRQSYDLVVRGTQLINMANKALGTLEGMEDQIQSVLGVIDEAAGVLDDISGFANFCISTLDGVVSEITSLVQSMVQDIIDEVFNQLEDLYDSVLDSIEEAIGVDVAALMALAPMAGTLLEQAMALLPADMVGEAGGEIGKLKQYLDIASSIGSFNGLMRTLTMANVMIQVNEIMSYVNINSWIPDSTKGVLSARFTGFKDRAFIADTGKPNYSRILREKISLPEQNIATAATNIETNIDQLETLTYGADPRCQGCIVDSSSVFETW